MELVIKLTNFKILLVYLFVLRLCATHIRLCATHIRLCAAHAFIQNVCW